ncbi:MULTISPECIES: bifunctional 2-polyprenyl-6-hydroxyphenol methylase/3-demethylubiquinol 3-O-methyltransferase UbiG [Methylobacterium]|uniref:Ubiquinone biosynthesis O-methyltransferase n=1 Tax=Methylobacterium jeotgali TaxID=381630 RepID=A0ABQ4SQC3_9HYPH|nr:MULTISPECIES: bifunctional 2-polyprenyl-6-hydroxyphenol methylase/3-demethylubiquinol 3-O-methyltransferase UbiG [Methylobacterium]PIU07014.1 MAG: bifunctional 3-demethylubiquinol 3-O-methyltransferase/2-polyprenyl-6-hydroxyphenol methylase [Methylobacterium sp. CG09_land_8_20_14_0_10_71_15]PIU14318.1 MAG: bifunctional 3-demethylubiquinol 3-O-methyltransferase/2-polyprenyl-6-hydroxyphenol methylase [Methylobacterium sp. CG08_land_8_20_14_0_20_71_15]GBU16698.1 3-demethylubiquinone-9 3-methyltr
MTATSTIDRTEVARFDALSARWWDERGPMRVLHRFNPVRLAYIRDAACAHFRRDPATPFALDGLTVVDIGCGGGVLSEPLARLGARVTGLEPAAGNLAVARAHSEEAGLAIDYRGETIEAVVAGGERFDIVLAMEVVEHVADRAAFLRAAAEAVRPGGLLFAATINRTLRSFALAIVGAEYVLRWLPRGTHDWEKFVTPAELTADLESAGLSVTETTGVVYTPLDDGWRRSRDTGVNYMLRAERPEASR